MITFVFWVIGLFIIVIQTTFIQGLPVWFGRPDFLFILFVFIAYRFAWIPGIVLVFSLSWITDVVSGIHLGFYPLVCLFLFAALKSFTYRNPIKESTYQLPLLGAAYFVSQFLLYIIYSFGYDQRMPDWQWSEPMQDVVLMMIVAIPMFVLYNALFQFLLKLQQERKSRRASGRVRRRIRPER